MTSQLSALLCHYRYDPLDRLINQTQTGTSEVRRFYCKNRLSTEIQGAMRQSIFQFGDQLLAQQQGLDGALETTLLATDQQRSVLQALKANCQNERITYSPYGHRPSASGLHSLLGFAGERPDTFTRHYLLGNGYRAFNPILMRFTSPDNLSPFGKGDVNAYAYCLGDPVNFSDPTGHVLDAIKKMFKPFVKFTGRNVPLPNSLEGIRVDEFLEISKYLGHSDMDSLSNVSHRLNELSNAASATNLKSYLELARRNRRPIHPVMTSPGSYLDYVLQVDGRIKLTEYPPLQGVGSAALKRFDETVKGGKSLKKFINDGRRDVVNTVYSWSFLKSEFRREAISELHAIKLLERLNKSAELVRK